MKTKVDTAVFIKKAVNNFENRLQVFKKPSKHL